MITTIDNINTLNAAQKAVLISDAKRVLVLAGPGAGKTFVLTEWIKQQWKENEKKSYKILGLTFTNKAADEMNKRLKEDLSFPFQRVNLMTFHGLATKVLGQFGYHIGVPSNFKICGEEIELIEILKNSLKKIGINNIYNPQKYLYKILDYKKKLISADALPVGIDKQIYEAYQKELIRDGYLDFDDLLFKAIELFKTYPAFAKHYQKIYPYICIDELQDTNLAQYELLQYLINSETNLLAVGDDNQLIFE